MAQTGNNAGEQTALLERLFASTTAGLAVYTRDFRYALINPVLAAMNGRSVEDHLGRRVEEIIPDLPEVAAALRRVLASGEVVTGDIVGRTPADPASDHHWVTSYHPIRDEDGEIIAIGAVVVDVTQRRMAEAALRRSRDESRFLADASRLLASSLDLHATLESVADLAVPIVADWCAVDLLDDRGRAHNVALAHADPRQMLLGRALPAFADRHAESAPPVRRVIETGRHELHAEAGEELLLDAARNEEEQKLWRSLGIRSVLIVPMIARGRTIGALSFVIASSERRFGPDDVPFAERLAAHCALAVDNARLFSERTEAARALQENLLPPGMPDLAGFDLAARYRAAGGGADVGGDFYDVFPVGPDSWLLAIGDVQGKGPRAAAVTGLARYTIRAAAARGAGAIEVVNTLNEALIREEGGRRFLTLVYATLDVAGPAPRISVTNAGHPVPLVVRAAGGVERIDEHGLLLGIAPELKLAETRLELEPGDALVLYTDGVIEAERPEGALGEDGLQQLLERCAGATADDIADLITTTVLGNGEAARDDVAVLVARRR